jgi:small subunit ribosomal protein S14
MKYLVVNDKKKRKLAVKYQLKKLCLKALFLEEYLFKNFYKNKKKPTFLSFYKFSSVLKISYINKKGSLGVIKNRCNFTGRSQAIIRYYKISRIVFRELASYGDLLGIKKSSW